ncbi:MAG: aminopeptidase N [Halioglobus sp.]|nr:aminopeptidase N [Halioglobus sp.]
MPDADPATIYLKDYRPPHYLINRTELHFELHEDHAIVSSTLHLLRDPAAAPDTALVLQGQGLELLSVSLDRQALAASDYAVDDASLRIHRLPEQSLLQIRTRIRPQDNTALEGLYKSRTMFCTQCEAEGFRKITYYLDRPDVMSVFTVTIDADKTRYPVLLSNGNLFASEELPEGRHRTVWHDPFRKPAYLFALVAGDLTCVEDHFTTMRGRDVILRMYVEPKDADKCAYAMQSLQQAMRWDEQAYGREYDLDLFNIVAVDDFNMGAMENKSLNIFNTSCVLCSADVTTDAGFQRVQAIVAHEYFHNWSGNRVTCRDWFQLSLKEGFTVFRDAQFSADMCSSTVKRVEDVTLLRTAQFAEDAGPMAHPIRPQSYMEINNFYTLTVYEKGAEVVRMLHTLLGAERFRRGSDLYFERHDGQAVTCEDFVRAMEDASGEDLTQFRHWYNEAGTPRLQVRDEWDADTARYTLHVTQSCPPTPGQPVKPAFVIPLAIGLLGDAGNLPLTLAGEAPDGETSDNTQRVLTVDRARQSFVFTGVRERPIPSLLRGFSAPVRLDYPYSAQDLCALMSRDGDGFVRWDSAQALATQAIHAVQDALRDAREPVVEPLLLEACAALLRDTSLDAALVAEMLRLPGENYLAELASQTGGADVDAIHRAREIVQDELGRALAPELLARFDSLAPATAYASDATGMAHRSLRNTCLDLLVSGDAGQLALAQEQLAAADNLTDRLAALRAIAFYAEPALRDAELEAFFQRWQHESLVVNQWLQVQAAMPDEQALARVRGLMNHPAFEIRNPNKLRAVVGVFSAQNAVNFHRSDGEGYRFLADVVLDVDARNPQMASRLLTPLTKWRNYSGRDTLMRAELARLSQAKTLSPDVYEVVTKALQQAV